MSLPPLITAMLEARFYPHRPATVTLAQTHISYVLLAGDHVYKIKKPVRFSFLDFSTLALRRHFCHEEVRLNRRLAADTYRGVLGIRLDGSRFELCADDDPGAVEYAVHMRRLPSEWTLDRRLRIGAVTPETIDQLVARLVEFHRHADSGPAVTANGDPAAVWRVLDDNFTEVRRFRDVTIAPSDDDAIQEYTRAFLQRHDALLRRRQAEHRIRECHGDLHTEHIYVGDGLTIVDCIEFNERFRFCDVASDIAFLAMDLDFKGHPELAARLVEQYGAVADDGELRRLMPFYQCYRAYVRGKVDSLTSSEAEVAATDREAARLGAARHFALAYRYTWTDQPCVVVIAGLSGTGKSAVASTLHSRTGFVHLNSDVVRKWLAGLDATTPAGGAYADGLYTPEQSARTYQALLDKAGERLAAGGGVIVDATFQRRADRDAARALAYQHSAPVLLVECRCSEDVVRERLAKRAAHGGSISDADWNIYREQRQRFEALGDDEHADAIVVDTNAATEAVTASIERALRDRLTHTRPPKSTVS